MKKNDLLIRLLATVVLPLACFACGNEKLESEILSETASFYSTVANGQPEDVVAQLDQSVFSSGGSSRSEWETSMASFYRAAGAFESYGIESINQRYSGSNTQAIVSTHVKYENMDIKERVVFKVLDDQELSIVGYFFAR